MAIRKIRTIGDEILGHNTKPVKLITPRTALLIGDMLDTMYEANGVGLAAPQVECVDRGIWVRPFGRNVYVMPPYVISDEELATLTGRMIDILKDPRRWKA